MNNKITFQNEISVQFPIDKMGSLDIQSIDIVIKAYKKYANFGQEVEFLVNDYQTEEEVFCDTYTEALEYNIDKIN